MPSALVVSSPITREVLHLALDLWRGPWTDSRTTVVLDSSRWIAGGAPPERAGKGHLKGYDPADAPKRENVEHIKEAGLDYYDDYWKDFWQRLYERHGLNKPTQAANAP